MVEASAENAEADGWCSQSEAAQRLTAGGDVITQQQLSRYLERHREISRREGANGQAMLVNFAELRRHREENIRVQEKPGGSAGEDDEAAQLRLRERRANAEKAEFELARTRGELIPREDVIRAVLAAGDALREAHRTTRFSRAEALEATQDARAKATLLIEQDTKVEEAFALALQALATGTELEGERDEDDQA